MSKPNGNGNQNGSQHGSRPNRTSHRPKQRLVDFLHVRADYQCALLGAFGFSTYYIKSKTGLSPGQIGYRLKKAEISRMDFRNGQSVYAEMVLRNVRQVAQEKLVKHLYNVTPPRTGESAGLKLVA